MDKIYLQEKITGTEGQVVVINSAGEAEAQTKAFGIKPRLSITAESGAVISVSGNNETISQTSTGEVMNIDLSGYGLYTLSASKDGNTSIPIYIEVDTVQIYEIEVHMFIATINVTIDSGSVVTCTCGNITQTKTSTGTVSFAVTKAGTYSIVASLNGRTNSDTAIISYNGQVINITLEYYSIYGVQWEGTSSSVWSRTDNAANFINPVPAVNNGMGSSPFDNLAPWSGMQKVTDPAAGVLVSIPKFWYKWTRSGTSMKLQIADKAVEGFHVSPAHQDRGDGVGERSVVYVGRYHSAENYKSRSNTKPEGNKRRNEARTGIHNLGSTVWQFDFSMLWTIYMLYLVEFADWNTQKTIGNGSGGQAHIGVGNTGLTDNMQYHTGTVYPSRNTYGAGCQYRWIEDMWGNFYDWVDGIYFNATDIYNIKNPALFSDTSGGIKTGTRLTASGYVSEWNIPTQNGFDWALFPSALDGSGTTYICDYYHYMENSAALICGGYTYTDANQDCGLFYMRCFRSDESAFYVGCRVMKLP